MKKIVLILAIIGLVVMIGALYRAGLGLAEEDPAPGATEQTLLAASAVPAAKIAQPAPLTQ